MTENEKQVLHTVARHDGVIRLYVLDELSDLPTDVLNSVLTVLEDDKLITTITEAAVKINVDSKRSEIETQKVVVMTGTGWRAYLKQQG